MDYLFDTSAYSQLLRGNPAASKALQSADKVFIPSFVLAELRFGHASGSKMQENEKLLNRFIAAQKVQVLLPDHATTDYFVATALYARKKGVALASHDIWIAALAQQWDAKLLTYDRDFAHLNYPDLKLRFVDPT